MTSRLNPYLSFAGDARQAMELYRDVFGGTLEINTFAEGGLPDGGDGVMHALLETPDGYTLMAADLPPDAPHDSGSSISVSISGDDADALRRQWEALSASGTVTMPLARQSWGDEFGMCVDRHGVSWLVNITTPQG